MDPYHPDSLEHVALRILAPLHWGSLVLVSTIKYGLWHHQVQEEAILAGLRIYWWQLRNVRWMITRGYVKGGCSFRDPCSGRICPRWYGLHTCHSPGSIVEDRDIPRWLYRSCKAQVADWGFRIADVGEIVVLSGFLQELSKTQNTVFALKKQDMNTNIERGLVSFVAQIHYRQSNGVHE